MSDCLITDGILREGCYKSVGGILEAYITNKENVTAIVPDLDGIGTPSDEGIVTGITLATSTYFQVFQPNKDSSSWNEEIMSEVPNGTIGYNQSVNLIFAKKDATKRNIIRLLGLSDLIAIVKDMQGKYWLLGEWNGLDLTEGSGESGVMLNDLNGWNITLSGPSKSPAREVDPDIIDDLFEA